MALVESEYRTSSATVVIDKEYWRWLCLDKQLFFMSVLLRNGNEARTLMCNVSELTLFYFFDWTFTTCYDSVFRPIDQKLMKNDSAIVEFAFHEITKSRTDINRRKWFLFFFFNFITTVKMGFVFHDESRRNFKTFIKKVLKTWHKKIVNVTLLRSSC